MSDFAFWIPILILLAVATLPLWIEHRHCPVCGAAPRPAPSYEAKRSSKWAALEENWLKVHPKCAACGCDQEVAVHHKKPFHLYPELELDPSNLITLCEYHDCHLMIGHGGDWHAYNPHVEEDSRFMARRIQQRQYE